MRPDRKKKILEKMSRKDLAASLKIKKALADQRSQMSDLEGLLARIRELQAGSEEPFYDTPSQFRAARFYSSKLAEQLEMVANRMEFIQMEIDNLVVVTRQGSLKRKKIDSLIAEAKQLIHQYAEREADKKTTYPLAVRRS
jgi:hypothetical protein